MTAALLVPLGSLTAALSLRSGRRRLVPLAMAPLFFGLQQLSEGVVWLGLNRSAPAPEGASGGVTAAAALIYLFFAYGFWPLWIPWSAHGLLPRKRQQGLLPRLVLLLGCLPGLLLWLPLLGTPEMAIPRVVAGSLSYGLPPGMVLLLPAGVGPLLYAALIVVPLAMVPSLRLRVFAFSLLLSFFLAQWANSNALSSIWCYAAALLSLQILALVLAPNSAQAWADAS